MPYPTEIDRAADASKIQANLVLADGTTDEKLKLLGRKDAAQLTDVIILRRREDLMSCLHPLPSEASPRRPATNENEYGRLANAATELGGMAPLFLLVVHETAHRCSAVGLLRWSDLELSDKPGENWVRWREENDKIGFQHRTPLSSDAVDALKAARKAGGSIGDAWVFPSPADKARSVSRHFLRDLWKKLETAAKLERQPGRGWHSLRRKFATDLKDTPLKDLCYMGGWKDPQTVLKCYQQPDESTMRNALDRRHKRSASA